MTSFTEAHQARNVTYTLDNADPFLPAYSQAFTPRRVVLHIRRTAGQPWAIDSMTAYGPRLLKSGADGKEERSAQLCTWDVLNGRPSVVVSPDAPQWAHDIADHTLREASRA